MTGEQLGFGSRRVSSTPPPRRERVAARRADTEVVRPVEASPALTIEQFIADHGAQLMRLAYLVTGSQVDAEDLWQETFTDVHRKWSKVSAAVSPHAYVRTMMMNRHTSAMRRKWTGEHPTDPAAYVMTSQAVADPSERVDSDDALWQMLSTLPPRMREVLVLRYFEDLDDHAISEALGLAVSSVRSTASRALAHLRDLEAQGGGAR